MRVTVKLFAMLQKYAPEGQSAGEPFEVTLSEDSSVADLAAHLGMPQREIKIAYVNGRARAPHFRLTPDAEVGIFPPIGGG